MNNFENSIKCISDSNNLYFPVRSDTDTTGHHYWLASPACFDSISLSRVDLGGCMDQTGYSNSVMSLRPLVRLKVGVTAKQDTNNVWKLQ